MDPSPTLSYIVALTLAIFGFLFYQKVLKILMFKDNRNKYEK